MVNEQAVFSFSRAHQQALERGMGPDEALGFALGADLATREAHIPADNLLAGKPSSTSLVQLNISGLCCADSVPEGLSAEAQAEAKRTIELWRDRTTAARFEAAKRQHFTPDELVALSEPSFGWGGGWAGHAILGYERILREGVEGLQDQVHASLQRATAAGEALQVDYLRGLTHVCVGIERFITNHARAAAKLAAEATDDAARQHYQAIAESCSRVCGEGARNFRDAVQLFFFVHVLEDSDSPGRIDQYLLPYYMAISPDAATRQATARPILESMWKRFMAMRSWNVCLAGQRPDGEDAANELTYLLLDMQEKFRGEAPNLSVRLFRGSSQKLLERCVEVISLGCGMPALYNDEVIVPALVELGIPLVDARNYAMNGCMQIDLQGCSHMGLEDGELNLAKCLELALHEGRSAITGRQVGPKTLPLSEIRDFATLKHQLEIQIDFATRLFVRSSNVFQQVMAETSPHMIRSLFIDDCIDRGLDMKRRGARYNNGQFLTEGVANTGDSLYSIDRLVFREKKFTLEQLIAIVDANWDGHEELRKSIIADLPKYGNDQPEVDRYTIEPIEFYFRLLNTLTPWRGGRYSGGLSTFSRAPRYGHDLMATPDGRRRGEPVADSCGPVQGRDRNGPTAMLNSVARLPHRLAASGFALNVKLSPSLFDKVRGPERYARVASLFATYFEMGGQQLQANVIDSATLRAAQQKPDEYRGLIVRVGGFSAKFVELGRAQQDDIIARTEHQ